MNKYEFQSIPHNPFSDIYMHTAPILTTRGEHAVSFRGKSNVARGTVHLQIESPLFALITGESVMMEEKEAERNRRAKKKITIKSDT